MLPQDFWQGFEPPGPAAAEPRRYLAPLPDGRRLALPIRPRPDGTALASLIINQASFAVQDALADAVAAALAAHAPTLVVGVPTLGLTLAAGVARRLGHARMLPLGTSRKFWYEDALSVPLTSVTSPGQQKRLWIDPRMVPMLPEARVALVDDVISTGTSMLAALALLDALGIRPVVLGAAMLQSDRWREALPDIPVEAALASPVLVREGEGWRPA